MINIILRGGSGIRLWSISRTIITKVWKNTGCTDRNSSK